MVNACKFNVQKVAQAILFANAHDSWLSIQKRGNLYIYYD